MFFLGTVLAVEAKTLLSQQELRDFYSLIWHQGPQIMWRERKQKVKSLWLFQVPAMQGITMKGHLSFISNYPGIDFNSVHLAFPQKPRSPCKHSKTQRNLYQPQETGHLRHPSAVSEGGKRCGYSHSEYAGDLWALWLWFRESAQADINLSRRVSQAI